VVADRPAKRRKARKRNPKRRSLKRATKRTKTQRKQRVCMTLLVSLVQMVDLQNL